MKYLITILLMLMSFSFVAEKVILVAAAKTSMTVQDDDAGATEPGKEQPEKANEDLKEKYCPAGLAEAHAFALGLTTAAGLYLQHFPSGFIDKPYMPPKMV